MNHTLFKTILAIESSCDETAAAVIENGTTIRSSSIASSALLHAKYGGIVPEVAAREQLDCIIPTIKEALCGIATSPIQDYVTFIKDSIDAIAVTQGPGLIGSLLVGVETAKTLAFATQKPIIPVNHVLAHMYANFFQTDNISFPAISLVVSGGHTELYRMESLSDIHWLGGTVDDAAGEAFDKTARLLGFENRGGPAIQQAALQYSGQEVKDKIRLPRPLLDKDQFYNFSFSGLKTAIAREVQKRKNSNLLDEISIYWLAHEVQETITDVLVKKTIRAAKACNARSIILSGGVAANLRLREKLISTANELYTTTSIHFPSVSLCTDNAAYIGSYAYFRGTPVDWHNITAIPDLSVEV